MAALVVAGEVKLMLHIEFFTVSAKLTTEKVSILVVFHTWFYITCTSGMSNESVIIIASPRQHYVISSFTIGSLIFLDDGLKLLFLLRLLRFLFLSFKLVRVVVLKVQVLFSLDTSLRYSAIALIVDHELTIVVLTGIVLLIDQVKHIGAPFTLGHSFTALITAWECRDLPYIFFFKFEDWALASEECVTRLASLWSLRSYILFITVRFCFWEPDWLIISPLFLNEVVVLLSYSHRDHRH